MQYDQNGTNYNLIYFGHKSNLLVFFSERLYTFAYTFQIHSRDWREEKEKIWDQCSIKLKI